MLLQLMSQYKIEKIKADLILWYRAISKNGVNSDKSSIITSLRIKGIIHHLLILVN